MAGGPLTGPLKTPVEVDIVTPLSGLIEGLKDTNHGFYEIRKIQLSASDSSSYWFYDVDILASREEDKETLANMEKNTGKKCCWWDDM